MKVRTFTLGAGADTVVFESVNTANGVDTITNFTAGAGGDKLNFKLFSADLAVGNLNVTGQAGQALSTNNKIYQTTINGDIASKNYGSGGSNFSELFAASDKAFGTGTSSGNKEVIVVKGNDVTQIYYVHDSDSNSTVENTEVNLVAVISNSNAGVTLTADNFVF